MSEAIIVAFIGGASGVLAVLVKMLMLLRKENRRDHRTVTEQLSELISGHKHLDGRITEVREDVREVRTDVRAVNGRLDAHIQSKE